MSTINPFDLLGDDDNDDPSHLIALQQQKLASQKPIAAAAAPPPTAKLPSKPLPPTQAVREARSNTAPARGGRGGRGAGFGQNRDFGGNDNGFAGGYGGGFAGAAEEGDGGKPVDREKERGSYGPSWRSSSRGGGRRGGYGGGGYGNGEGGGDGERSPRRVYERRSGTGRGNEFKREGAGRGNWGMVTDQVLAQETEENLNVDEEVASSEKQPELGDGISEVNKDNKEGQTTEAEEKEEEDKEMTLEEYEKVKEEKRKTLLAMKTEERKVEVDKELESMQVLSLKKGNEDIFIKLGSDKDGGKKRENSDREERVKKPLSINEFLKPSVGEKYYGPSSRGRGRGRGDRAPFKGGFGGGLTHSPATPSIEDQGQFPTLDGK